VIRDVGREGFLMSTICKLITTATSDELDNELRQYLKSISWKYEQCESQYPQAEKSDFLGSDDFPSEISMGTDENGFGCIFWNSF
jgi:hypothetical protein